MAMGGLGIHSESGRSSIISTFQFRKVNEHLDVDFCDLNLTLKSSGKYMY